MRWLACCVLLALLCSAHAGFRHDRTPIHRGHEHECYIRELDIYLSPGRQRQMRPCGVAACIDRGDANYVQVQTCNVIVLRKKCSGVRIIPEKKEYPFCCLRHECI